MLRCVTQGHTHLNNGINRTRLLTETAVDAFGHVNVVASRPPAAISTSLSFDGYGLDTHTELVTTVLYGHHPTYSRSVGGFVS